MLPAIETGCSCSYCDNLRSSLSPVSYEHHIYQGVLLRFSLFVDRMTDKKARYATIISGIQQSSQALVKAIMCTWTRGYSVTLGLFSVIRLSGCKARQKKKHYKHRPCVQKDPLVSVIMAHTAQYISFEKVARSHFLSFHSILFLG